MEFKASIDSLTKILTVIITIFFLSVIVYQIYAMMQGRMGIYRILLIVLLAVLIIFSYLVAPQGYTLDKDKLVIMRPIGSKVVPREDIVQVSELRFSTFRLIGNAGYFGYYGIFWGKNYGLLKFYASKKSNLILIETHSNGKIVISPDNVTLLGLLKK